jgi:hypothetical protein
LASDSTGWIEVLPFHGFGFLIVLTDVAHEFFIQVLDPGQSYVRRLSLSSPPRWSRGALNAWVNARRRWITPAPGCYPSQSAIKPRVMPYAVKFYAYIFIANVLAVVIVVRWVKTFGFMVSLIFGLVFAYLTIVTGRWLFGRKEL